MLVSYGIGILLWRKWRDAPSIRVSGAFTLLIMPAFFGINALIAGNSWQADLLFVLLVCPLLIAGGLRIERVHPVLLWFGAISFPLYAVHVPAMRLVAWLDGDRLWGIALCIPLAWALKHLAAAVHAFDFARLVQRRREGRWPRPRASGPAHACNTGAFPLGARLRKGRAPAIPCGRRTSVCCLTAYSADCP